LLLFANRPENNPPKHGDPNVVYFGPGIHKPERIALKAGQTLYLAGGAVVKGRENGSSLISQEVGAWRTGG
jgi:hypothetical protein